MESFIKTILPTTENSSYISHNKEVEIKPSIAGRIAKSLNIKSSIFASKTTRQQKLSQTPGPGSYIHEYSGVHRIIKNIPEGFGSTSIKSPNFLNISVQAPYSDPSYLLNPGVGNYKTETPIKLHKILNNRKFAGDKNIPFLSSKIRPCLALDINNEFLPGPGAYDLNLREELNVLDQKFSQRYRKSPFGAKSPRFSSK